MNSREQAKTSTNRLIEEKSPYLLQHAHDPVDWYPWGEKAFRKAGSENKPVFLSIGYSTCHWCHVMKEESFSDPALAEQLNRDFVSIKVDREERPDIDNIYMRAVVFMKKAGGWPLSVFLTPDKEPFYGGTYFPPDDRWGRPGFRKILSIIAEKWKNDRTGLKRYGQGIVSHLKESTEVKVQGMAGLEVIREARRSLSSYFDENYGGFGSAPKFPQTDILCFLLREWKREGEERSLKMVERTLEQIIRGGIFDHVEGGVHRYSTDNKWLVPHFEKMLYDQAVLSNALMEAHQATGKPEYGIFARRILEYVMRDMTDPKGGFYSAEDADSPDPNEPSRRKEGAFYMWTAEEVSGLLNRDEKRVFSEYFRIEKNLIHASRGYDPGEKGVSAVLEKLYRARSRRHRPHLDDKVLVEWNGLMISSLCKGGRVLTRKRYISAARKAADFILREMRGASGRLYRRYRDSSSDMDANLNDYAFFIQALIDLYETTFERRYLEEASSLAEDMQEYFLDREAGGFFFTAKDSEKLIFREKKIQDNVVPAGNSVAVMDMLRLSEIKCDTGIRRIAGKTLAAFAGEMHDVPTAYLYMLGALYRYIEPGIKISITGPEGSSETEDMLDAVYETYLPDKTLVFRAGKDTAAYICGKGVCEPPVKDAKELRKALVEREQD